MGLTGTPISQRVHIAFFGCRNAGKSSVVNAVTNQEISIVSETKGTTTDPVKKTMELLPIGPVVIIDTPGIDDVGDLGQLRIEKTNDILAKTDVAILVVDVVAGVSDKDRELINLFKSKNLPYIIVYNKKDLYNENKILNENEILVSAKTKENIEALKNKIGTLAKKNEVEKYVVKDLLSPNDVVVLVIPIDESAPKNRLILPQQITLREVLDANATVVCCQDSELDATLKTLNKNPKLVITDSQAYHKVKDIVPSDIILTSFSILMARYKGELSSLINGAQKISQLMEGDRVLISEGCTHHRQCNDIGTVKFPKWLKEFTQKDLNYEFSSGDSFPKDLSKYSLIIHCGGCMLNEKEMKNRQQIAKENNIPIVNYGIAIAYMNGILERTLKVFPDYLELLKK